MLSNLISLVIGSVEMADLLREQGKIYVVVAVVVTIVIGMIAYLFVVDRKISKFERRQEHKNSVKNDR